MRSRPNGGQLPKFLVQKFGAPAVRNLISPDDRMTPLAVVKRDRRLAKEKA
jgi:hypothetical protein